MKKIFTLLLTAVTTVSAMAQMTSSMNFIGGSNYSATVGTMTISGSGAKDTLTVADANTSITFPAMSVLFYGNTMTVPSMKIANLTYTMTGNPMQGNAVFTWDKAATDTIINFPNGIGNKTVKITSLHAVYTLATRKLETTYAFQYGSMPGVVTFTETGYYTPANAWNLVGQGTKANPYRIIDSADFAAMSKNISATNTGNGQYFQMMNDIDFGGSADASVQLPAIGKAGITNISTVNWGFQGSFDGGNKTISGIYHTNNGNDDNGKFNALFSSLGEGGTVKNLIFGKNNSINSYNYSAPFVCLNKGGVIENCTNYAPVTGANAFAAGICGYLVGGKGTIRNCWNNADITAMTYASGIVAGTQSGKTIGTTDANYTHYIVDNCINSGSMKTTNETGAAGIAGSYSGSITNCTNLGTITASKTYAGGIVALMTYVGKVSNNINRGTVTGGDKVGGIIGNIMKGSDGAADVSLNINQGTVTATGTSFGDILGGTARTVEINVTPDPTKTVYAADANGDGTVDASDINAVVSVICGGAISK